MQSVLCVGSVLVDELYFCNEKPKNNLRKINGESLEANITLINNYVKLAAKFAVSYQQ
jgi:hypothetical protein